MKKRKINLQKVFNFISFIFASVCVLWYGGRFIYFYQDSQKTIKKESNTLATVIKNNNLENETNFKQIGQTYYFYNQANNNYLTYSNLTWRIIKVNKDNSIVLISDSVLTTLAYGDIKNDYENSNLLKWLNKTEETTTSLEEKLNLSEKYLIKSNICIDTVNELNKIKCQTTHNENYLGLLSLEDYINTGANDSFINNGQYNYLANKNKDNEIWYITSEGKLDVNDGQDLYGIKPIITLNANLEVLSGKGTLDDPYKIEDKTEFFASYVKLGNDIWRVYDINENNLKLVLTNYITENEQPLTYVYSKAGYYHNDTIYGSLAYYLNHAYLNSLSYKDLIFETKYINTYYGEDTNFSYPLKNDLIDTKITVPSIGDIILNNNLDNYYTTTGISADEKLVYAIKKDGQATSKNTTLKANIVPTITINKENLKAGSGTENDPYRTQ